MLTGLPITRLFCCNRHGRTKSEILRRSYVLEPRVAAFRGYPGNACRRLIYPEWVTSRMMTEPRWGTGRGGVQTQGSSLREQPWALRRNSFGVEDIDNSDQCQISSYQVLLQASGSVLYRFPRPKGHGWVNDWPTWAVRQESLGFWNGVGRTSVSHRNMG